MEEHVKIQGLREHDDYEVEKYVQSMYFKKIDIHQKAKRLHTNNLVSSNSRDSNVKWSWFDVF